MYAKKCDHIKNLNMQYIVITLLQVKQLGIIIEVYIIN